MCFWILVRPAPLLATWTKIISIAWDGNSKCLELMKRKPKILQLNYLAQASPSTATSRARHRAAMIRGVWEQDLGISLAPEEKLLSRWRSGMCNTRSYTCQSVPWTVIFASTNINYCQPASISIKQDQSESTTINKLPSASVNDNINLCILA